MAQLSFQLPINVEALRTQNPGRLNAGFNAQCTHCERCAQDGRKSKRVYGQQPGVVPSIEQKRAGNAITYEDTRPGAKCGYGDRLVLRHGSDEVGRYMSRLKYGKTLGDD